MQNLKDGYEAKLARVGEERDHEFSVKEAELTKLQEDTGTR